MKSKTVLYFDGVCNLCNGAVDFFIQRDKERKIYYSPLQGNSARTNLNEERIEKLDTVVLYHNDKIYIKSQAIIQALILIGRPYSFAVIFKIIPRFINDFIYDLIATNRYRIFGKKENCRLPKPEERALFLE